MRTSWTTAATCAGVLLLLGGCSGGNESIVGARQDYDEGRFESAHENAAAAASRSSGADRAEAAYLAGVSAYRMGDFDEAERQFFIAQESKDPVTLGRTNATLGLMRRSQGRPASSAGFFKVAAEHLDGEEGATAARNAADAYRQLGRSYDADEMMKLARAKSVDAGSRSARPSSGATVAAGGSGAYTIQLGAFSKRSNADSVVRTVSGTANRQGIGAPRVIETNVNGRTLHIVQVGAFESRAEAENARRRLGQSDSIVAAAR